MRVLSSNSHRVSVMFCSSMLKEYFRKKNPKPSNNTKLNHSKVLLKTRVRNVLNFYTTLIALVICHLILYLS